MYHYDPAQALEEISEDANLPSPVHVRDMILRRNLSPERALELNREFLEYQRAFADALRLGKKVLTELTEVPEK